jgi:hypothetical protein
VGTDVLDALVAETLAIVADLPRLPGEVQYALWSCSGFTPTLEKRAQEERVLLPGTEQIATQNDEPPGLLPGGRLIVE